MLQTHTTPVCRYLQSLDQSAALIMIMYGCDYSSDQKAGHYISHASHQQRLAYVINNTASMKRNVQMLK